MAGVQVPLASCRRTCWPLWSGGRSGHGTSSASAGGLSGVKSCVSVLGWERPVPGCRAVKEQRLSVK